MGIVEIITSFGEILQLEDQELTPLTDLLSHTNQHMQLETEHLQAAKSSKINSSTDRMFGAFLFMVKSLKMWTPLPVQIPIRPAEF